MGQPWRLVNLCSLLNRHLEGLLTQCARCSTVGLLTCARYSDYSKLKKTDCWRLVPDGRVYWAWRRARRPFLPHHEQAGLSTPLRYSWLTQEGVFCNSKIRVVQSNIGGKLPKRTLRLRKVDSLLPHSTMMLMRKEQLLDNVSGSVHPICNFCLCS